MAVTGAAVLAARVTAADPLEANEHYQRAGWTDGLPIVPPTEERVRECLEWALLPRTT